MFRLALAMFAALIFVAGSRAEPPKEESLKEFVVKNKTRHAVGLYLQGKKVGWMIVDLDLGTFKNSEVAVETTEMLLSLSVDGERTVSKEKEKVYYSLEGDGPIVYAEQLKTQDNKDTKYVAVRSANGMTITMTSAGAETKREIALPKSTIGDSRSLSRWLESGPNKGDSREHWGTDWDEEVVDSKEIFTYQGKTSMLWGGLKTDVYKVKIDMKGAIFDAEVLANGNPIKGKIGGLLEMRAESEEVAKKLDKGDIVMIAASSIKVDRNLGNSKSVTALTLEVVDLSDFKLPESHRQHVHTEDNKVLLDLKADFRVAKGAALSEADRKKFTSASPTVQSDHEKVKKLAAKIVGNETEPLKKADLLKSWVYKKIRKSMAANSNTTLGVLDTMAGDCTEHTLLFVSLARAVGLPARELTGVAHIDQIFGWHAWAEIHDGHQWVSVDPTWNELYVDATHIVFSHDTQNHAWLNVLGKVSFKAVKIERKSED